jgi:NAD(P)H-dependent flavin oxidoreductase YrpB (nitropropane dioxygenase family)
MLHTSICDVLGIETPIIAAPMGPNISTPELAAAVSNAGGLGMISFGGNPPALLRRNINRIRELTDKPFGVNFLIGLPFPVEEQFNVCIEEKVPVLSFFWGDPSPYVSKAHDAGIKVLDQVGSVRAAKRSVQAGVDVVIAQGMEAGGHVAGKVTTMVLVPRIVDAVRPVPVAAAGGIGDARGLVAALALGADGVVIGTRLLATHEANAHALYKQKILQASEEDTTLTTLFGGGWPNAPHRALRTAFVEQWLPQEGRGSEQRPDEPTIGETDFMGQRFPVQRFASLPPEGGTVGEVDSMAMLAGQSVGLANDIKAAAAIIKEMVEGAAEIIHRQIRAIVQQPKITA